MAVEPARVDARAVPRLGRPRGRGAELLFSTLDQATTGRNPQGAVIEGFALGVRPVQDSPLYSRIVESERELFGMFSRSHVFPIGQFPDGIAHALRRCGADIPEPDQANIADILPRVALGIIMFPTDRLDTSDPAAVRRYAARYLVPIIRRRHEFDLSVT
jgi:TetR/AcrR family transcriptional regulator